MGRRARTGIALFAAGLAVGLAWWTLDADPTPSRVRARASRLHDEPRVVASRSDAVVDAGRGVEADVARVILPAGLRAHESDAPTAVHAQALLELYERWDAEQFAALMHDGADEVVFEENMDWFHERLGECASPEILLVRESGSIRWVYPCADGELEAEFVLDDDGRVRTLFVGAHRMEPPADVREAAEAVLALQRGWDDELFGRAFSEAFDRDETRAEIEAFTAEWGPCTLRDVDLGGVRGGLLNVTCTRGPRLLKVQLGEDGRIVEAWFGEPRGF